MFSNFKDKLYNKLVCEYPEVQPHYEGYKDSNPQYHGKHRMKSFKFLRKLRKYYKNGRLGDFPKPPQDYYVKGSGVFVSSTRQEPINAAPAAKPDVSPAVMPAAPVAKPVTPAADKPTAPVNNQSAIAPYMNGSESEKGKRTSAYHFAASLIKYDVISFDIFDTLIFRKLNQPADVFMLVGEKLNIFGFYEIRKKAEEDVRKFHTVLYGKKETTIEEIYERVAYYTGIDPKKGVEAEFEVELDMCFANPYMLRVFEILKAAGKRIVATSNMYLQKEKMKILLKNCGYEGLEDILVSCDYGWGKGQGDLFNILKDKMGKVKIIHIGDNMGMDINGAKKAGIDAKYYQACRELGDMHRSPGISWLIESAYRGIVNTTLHNGTEVFSPLWEYGFVYGGLLALGYVNWIHRKAKEEGISKILFLSRDGFLLKEIYDKLFDDIPSEYVFWSRIAAFRNVSAGERYSFLQRVVIEQSEKNKTIGEMLEWVGLTELEKIFYDQGLLPDCLIHEGNYSAICDLFVKNWNEVDKALVHSKSETDNYLRKIVEGHQTIAVVDLGWTSRSSSTFVKYVRDYIDSDNSMMIKIYMVGSITTRENGGHILNSDIECYMFHSSFNRDISGRIRKESGYALEIIEKLFNAPQCSFLGYSNSGEMEFAPPEIDNYKGFVEIEAGILDFCKRYYEAFNKYAYLLNIDGYDAFIPLRLLFNNKKAALNLIGALSYNNGIVPTSRENLLNAFGGQK